MLWDKRCAEWLRINRNPEHFSGRFAILRFYEWSPSCITLGYNQKADLVDLNACARDGLDVVKRPTGGRAVLHADEITYSFISPVHTSNQVYYRMIHQAIAHGLKKCGIEGQFQKSNPDFKARNAMSESLACFTASAKEELEVFGKKLVGSAQRRFGDILLQHGSLLLSEKHKLLIDYILETDPDVLDRISRELDEKTISIAEILGTVPEKEILIGDIIQGFKDIWGSECHEMDQLPFDFTPTHSDHLTI